MDEPEQQKNLDSPKRRRHPWRLFLLGFFVLLAAMFVAVYLGFNYYGERFLRRYLQEKISNSSNGLYRADFKTVQVNILTGKVVIDSFELIPDTVQYNRLKAQGRVARALYQVSFSSLTIDKVHFRQIYAGRRVNFRQLTVQRPLISIVGFPDTVTARRSKWRVIYEDLYPAVSGVFNDFHIDSVKVSHGLLLTSFRAKTGRETTGEYEFSSVLKDVSVNPFSYYNRERVFYSRDVELVIHNFESQLADSLYSIRADEIGFSLTKSILYGRKVSLQPNFNSGRIRQVSGGDLFRIDLPEFSIRGIDLYKAMTGREVEVSSVNLTDFFMQVYRNTPPPGTRLNQRTRKKITLAGLYTVVAKELRFIAIDSLFLKNGSFEFYGNLSDTRPEVRIGKVNLGLSQFRLDSLSHLDMSRIFYSRAIELDLERISVYLRDGIHCVNASAISFSTRKSMIDVQEASIFPDRKKNLHQFSSPHNTMFVNLPRLTFTGIDLKKVFNRRILDFDRLTVDEPEVRYTRFRPSKNPDPRFKSPEDFFETENEDVVYDLLKKYLWSVRGGEIILSHGLMKFSVDRNGTEIPLATSSFDLTMQQFLIDSVHGMNEQGYFYSRDFDLGLQSVSIVSPDSLKHLWADRVHIITRDSLIEADKIRVIKIAPGMRAISRNARHQTLAFEFSLRKLQLTGLNHKRLFLDKILKANEIILDSPSLMLKTSNILQPEGPPEETHLLVTKKFVHTFEIGRCLVRKGVLSYDGEEDRKASYFSLKDIEFALVDATVHIPEKGMHDGLIKFDSLHLRVLPLRAVIADSTYALEAGSLEVHSYPADIILKGIKVSPLKAWNEVPGRKTMATISIPELRFNGFYFDRAIFDNQWLLKSIVADHPDVSVELQQEAPNARSSPVDPAMLLRVPGFMQTVAVDTITIAGGRVQMVLHRPGKTQSYALPDVMIAISRFRVDSATRANPAGTPLFNAADVTLSAPGRSWLSPDSMYTYTIGRVGLSTRLSAAYFDSVTVIPNFSKADFSRKTGYQSDRIVLQIPRIGLTNIDFKTLIRNRELHAGKVTIEGPGLEDYLDKRLPFPAWKRPLMPAQMVAQIKFPLSIDTISVADGFAAYEEQTGAEPGRIFFDRMNATLTGLDTRGRSPAPMGSMDLHGTFRIMGLAPAEAWFHFQTDHPRDTFTLRASIGELELTAINPMLSRLVPASVRHGTATSTEIAQINANNSRAVGNMNFRYHHLEVKLHPTKPGTWNRLEQSLLTEVANLLLADDNPNEEGKIKTGIIYYERDTTKGFFNFVWKSVLSGIKSSVGVNDKIQKELKKHAKKPQK